MNALTKSSLDTDYDQIEQEIERLFVFQDKPISREKKAILIEEIRKNDFPLPAVLAGIRSLMSEDLTNLKLGTILSAIRRFIAYEPTEACKNCLDGIFVMRDGSGRKFALGCTCIRGAERARALSLARWDGTASMTVNNRVLICN